MRRLIALILLICTIVLSSSTLASCGLLDQNANGDNINDSGITGDDEESDNSEDNDTPSDDNNQDGDDVGQGGTDDENQDGPNDENQDGPNDESQGGSNNDNQNGDDENQGDDKQNECKAHVDSNNNDYCDICNDYLVVVIDFYVFNDLHGKFCDTDTQPGVDEIGTYFDNMSLVDDNMVILSSGDMWQGSAESNLTYGKILVEWMNALGFVSMTIGNHEFDWGEDAIRNNLLVAEFPFLAINIYDNTTGKLADYCTPSVMVERDGIQIGIIGAIGDCYSSISSDMVENVSFKLGNELTNLVKAESDRLRAMGADIIVYSLHDDSGAYDNSLSNGYVDVVFEGHTHQDYVTKDSYGVYHLQGGGENYGFSHLEISINSVTGNKNVTSTGIITTYEYKNLDDHAQTEEIEDRYSEIIEYAYADLGIVSTSYTDSQIEDFVAQLYLEAGVEKWGDKYNIVLGGGFLRTRTPYNLTAGNKKYADILSLFPFDNSLVLCSVSGSNLKNKFINTSSSDYHIAMSEYGSGLNISNNATYYIVVDTYTAFYAPNKLTIVEYYDETTYARDLLAEAIKAGRLEVKHDAYTLTSIPDALSIGKKLNTGSSTADSYYIKGTISSVVNTTYGNLYIKDEQGNEIYIYGLYDSNGNRYDKMTNQPKVGDTIVVYSVIYRYSSSTIELKNATIIEKE